MRRRARALTMLGIGAMIALVAATSLHAADTATFEYQVKATFLYKFTKFIGWPADAFPSDNAPFVIGVVGGNPFGSYLEESLAGQSVHGHPVRVVEFRGPEDVSTCAVLFVPHAMGDRLAEIAARIAPAPVLVVGESPGFAERGGIINFVLRDNKVKFEINPAAAKSSRLVISSKLLAIATVVGYVEKAEEVHAPSR